tara:strand:+ start:289 stop:555 length:267 start_codon:yes stop_codon:yes gene_type:complete
MTDMIERVARALYENFAAEPNDKSFAALANTWRKPARAAIAAMRDCTPEMLDAGSAAHPAGGYVRETLLTDIIECEWVAMCDAALEEK